MVKPLRKLWTGFFSSVNFSHINTNKYGNLFTVKAFFFFTNYFTFWLIILLSNIIQHLYFNWINNTSIISALFIGYPIARTSPAALRNLADSSAGISNIPTSFRKNIVFYSITRCWDLEHRRRKKTKVKRASHHLWRGICRFCCFLHSGSITMFLINSKYKKRFFFIGLTLSYPLSIHPL